MSKLKAAEEALLRNPPTPETWVCGRKTKHDGIEVECRGVLSGNCRKCHFCGKDKRASAKKLWPAYVAACAKAGIEPGTRWPVAAPTNSDEKPTRLPRRKGA